ncbi:MAG: precorrin-3B C(17)-methyltransferase [Hyphomicrobiales bacterium]
MTNKNPAIIVLSKRGETTAKRLKAAMPTMEIHALSKRASGDVAFTQTSDHLQSLFKQGRPIIGLCSSGILIRCLGGILSDKWQEPPVIAVAEDGSAVVPLLGGHHGANDLAHKIAKDLDTHPAITTSGDVNFGIALDQPPQGYHLSNPNDAKAFMAQVLAGESIQLSGTAEWLTKSQLPIHGDGTLKISITSNLLEGAENHLVYHPKTLVLGMGSERGAPAHEAIELGTKILADAKVSPFALACIASIDIKSDEAALHAVANHFNVPACFFSKPKLAAQEHRLENPSKVVKAEVGVAGVAEGAALAAVGPSGQLRLAKQKTAKVTAAIGEAPSPTAITLGQSRGRVFLVGVGPGDTSWRSGEAAQLLRQASDWVGYDLYLDLIQDLKSIQQEHRFPLGAEEKRVRHAMELASAGKNVAVVCSGDPGIYAMATLANELMDSGAAEGPLSDGARRVEVTVSPGISAFQAAAARIGAPIGHDFCCISLSDLLTPRDDIIKRLNAAAKGDFVIAFYNPRSKRRVTLLDEAFDILRTSRPGDTPVILATDLGRPAEHVRVFTLDTVNSEDVDMLTLVMVGSSNSKTLNTGDGKTWVYTPRGYDRKEI